MNRDWNYSGRELGSMDSAVNYHRWILDLMKPYLGRNVVEVGAGTGALSILLLEHNIQSLLALEPSANMFPLLQRRLADARPGCVVKTSQCTLSGATADLAAAPPDSILYINVLEHVEDDASELCIAHQSLSPGGRAMAFVPAHEWLMSPIDEQLGHFRRYSRSNLAERFEAAGFRIVFSAGFDPLGILPWWLRYRILGSRHMEAEAVHAFDRWGVPVSRVLASMTKYRFGKNLIVVGEKRG